MAEFKQIDVSADGVLVPAVAGKKIRVVGLQFTLDADGTCSIRAGTTATSGYPAMKFKEGGGINATAGVDTLFTCPAGESLNIYTSVGVKGGLQWAYL